jgi:hypothetical protein
VLLTEEKKKDNGRRKIPFLEINKNDTALVAA